MQNLYGQHTNFVALLVFGSDVSLGPVLFHQMPALS